MCIAYQKLRADITYHAELIRFLNALGNFEAQVHFELKVFNEHEPQHVAFDLAKLQGT